MTEDSNIYSIPTENKEINKKPKSLHDLMNDKTNTRRSSLSELINKNKTNYNIDDNINRRYSFDDKINEELTIEYIYKDNIINNVNEDISKTNQTLQEIYHKNSHININYYEQIEENLEISNNTNDLELNEIILPSIESIVLDYDDNDEEYEKEMPSTTSTLFNDTDDLISIFGNHEINLINENIHMIPQNSIEYSSNNQPISSSISIDNQEFHQRTINNRLISLEKQILQLNTELINKNNEIININNIKDKQINDINNKMDIERNKFKNDLTILKQEHLNEIQSKLLITEKTNDYNDIKLNLETIIIEKQNLELKIEKSKELSMNIKNELANNKIELNKYKMENIKIKNDFDSYKNDNIQLQNEINRLIKENENISNSFDIKYKDIINEKNRIEVLYHNLSQEHNEQNQSNHYMVQQHQQQRGNSY